MKVLCLNFSDITGGGAARAAYRLHHALRANGIDSMMQVVKASSGDWTVSGLDGSFSKIGTNIRPQFASFVRKFSKSEHSLQISTSTLPSRWPAIINKSVADIVNLHWLCAEMMSVEDIGRIQKPLVWTLHDMWAFCGAEHVSYDNRWKDGYTSVNKPAHERGIDLNRWVWNRKRNAWKKPLQIVTPSRWLADCVRQSSLMHGWPVITIPNAIDTDVWQPVDRTQARMLMGIPPDKKIIAFGAMSGGQAHHKGFDLLLAALGHLRGQLPRLEIIIFGQSRPKEVPDLGFPIYYTGHLHDDLSLRVLYSAADALVIPSRIDNLPNTGVESLTCGTPVIAFDTCGLRDIVTHQKTGWLAKAFDTEDLATGIQWALSDESHLKKMRQFARADAVARYSFPVVAAQYQAIYQSVLDRQ
ncbi:MAG: glycosyltransferase family 4 protein [Desulfuromonadales bacterium]|nr:glycosyltransferase family 4 protein [Desulfuromonadales bacterium]